MEDGGIESESIVRRPGIEVREREDVVELDEQEREKRQKVEEGGGGSGRGGGLLDNLLSKLASPRTPKPTTNDHIFEANDSSDHHDTLSRVSGDAGHGGDGGSKSCDEGEGGGGGGGVIDKLSSFFHRNAESEGEDVKNNDSPSEEGLKGGNEEVEKTNKGDQESENGTTNGGSSFISNLVPEIMAPEGDEASILIHSVVHD